jgi:hypothetical protein
MVVYAKYNQKFNHTTPNRSNGISLVMTSLLYLIGTSVEQVIAGIFMQADQAFVKGISSNSSNSVSGAGVSLFPSPQSYNIIFLMATVLSMHLSYL